MLLVLWALVIFALQPCDKVVPCLFVLNYFTLLFGGAPLETGLAGNENQFCNLDFV